jgi:hypothetical protein
MLPLALREEYMHSYPFVTINGHVQALNLIALLTKLHYVADVSVVPYSV